MSVPPSTDSTRDGIRFQPAHTQPSSGTAVVERTNAQRDLIATNHSNPSRRDFGKNRIEKVQPMRSHEALAAEYKYHCEIANSLGGFGVGC